MAAHVVSDGAWSVGKAFLAWERDNHKLFYLSYLSDNIDKTGNFRALSSHIPFAPAAAGEIISKFALNTRGGV